MVRRAILLLLVMAATSLFLMLLGTAAPVSEVQAQALNTSTPTPSRTPTSTPTPTVTLTPTITPTITPTLGPWPIFQHDYRHTGRSPFTGPANVKQQWGYNTGIGPLTGSPLIDTHARVYVGTGGYLYAFDHSGAARWRLPLGDSFGTALMTNDGTIYATASTGSTNYVYQIRTGESTDLPADGAIVASFNAPGSFQPPQTLAVAPDGTVYFGIGNTAGTAGVLYALTPNTTTGAMAIKWQAAVGYLSGSQPAIDPASGIVYVGSYSAGGVLYAISPAGAVLWRSEALGYVNSSPSIDTDGTIYVGSSTGLYALTPSGLVRWLYRTSSPINYSSPAIDVEGTILIGAGDQLLAVDHLGTLRWRQTCLPGGRVNSSPAISADGYVYYQAIQPGIVTSAALCASDPNGKVAWAFQTQYFGDNGPQVSSPAIGSDSVVYVGSPDGVLYALEPATLNPADRVIVPLVIR